MIHEHIKQVAKFVDEDEFQVILPDELSHDNEFFEDGDGIDPQWVQYYWRMMFNLKIRASKINVKEGDLILDACCGQGFLGEYFSGLGGKVIFCDLSPLQLNSLTHRFSEIEKKAHTVLADLLDLPFPDNYFDYVVGNSFLHHLPNVPKGLNELKRVLKKDGVLILFHEPSEKANYWETFPLSIIKDTTYNTGYTDLWQFDTSKLDKLFIKCGFEKPQIIGSGLLSAIFLNWYFILMNKLGIQNAIMIKPALNLRLFFYRIEKPLRKIVKTNQFPSIFISTRKS